LASIIWFKAAWIAKRKNTGTRLSPFLTPESESKVIFIPFTLDSITLFVQGQAKTLQENTTTVQTHFADEVFGRTSKYDPAALNSLPQLTENQDLGRPPSFAEINIAIDQMASHKAAGKNGIPAEAFKALDEPNRTIFHALLCKYWNLGEFDCDEWHVTMLKLLPKKGNQRLPKKLAAHCPS
jgi:hypothetical protein